MKPNLVYLNIVFGITLAILLVLSAIFLNRMAELSEADERVSHTYGVISKTDLLNYNLNKIESEVRGFLLTNDSSFFKNYKSSNRETLYLIEELRKSTADNKTQQKNLMRLRTWVKLRLDFLNQSLAAKNDTSLLKEQLLAGKNAMDSCISIFGVIKLEESHLLDKRNEIKSRYVYAAPRTFKLIFVFTLIIFIISFLIIAQELRRRARYQNELERKLLELNRMNSNLNEFSFIASHNLQEPLRKLRLFSDRLSIKHKAQLNDEAKQIVARIESVAASMHELMHDFVSFIDMHNTKEEISLVRLKDIIETVAAEIKNQSPAKSFSLEVAELWNVHGYANQLKLLIRCLLDNSAKFSRKDTPLEIKIYGEIVNWKDLPEYKMNVFKYPYYKITVADNGIGFDNIFSQKIFKLFQRLDNDEKGESAKGTGLAIVEHIMINHHGFVTAIGTINQGAQFNLFFPIKN